MNIKKAETKKMKLQEQIYSLRDEIKLLDNQIEAEKNSRILKLLKGTKWYVLDTFSSSITYDRRDEIKNNKNEDAFVTFVCDTLYPHGKIHISNKLELYCSDNEIGIRWG
jgi:hypothetical protein